MFRPGRMLALVAVAVAALSAPAALADLESDKAAVDDRIERLQHQIADAKNRESVLTTDIAAAGEQIDALQGRIDSLAGRVAELEAALTENRARLAELRELYREQSRHLAILQRNERIAQERLAQRVVDIYTSGQPDTIEILLSVSSLDDLIDQIHYLDEIARRDEQIVADVTAAREALAAARTKTRELRREQARTTRLLAERTIARRDALSELVGRRDQLAAARAERESLLAGIETDRHEAQEDLKELEQASEELAERLRAAAARAATTTSTGTGTVSASGLVWPVAGPVTSGFGQRWGRLHAGIDIGAGYGTPIVAAAGGTVVHAGWLGGYGNLVAIDHGNGLSTAYAHQQAIYVTVGQQVSQGQAVGEVGNTGYSFGAHLHFEVRVNGSPVDPLGYL